jgi:hypothetical protein
MTILQSLFTSKRVIARADAGEMIMRALVESTKWDTAKLAAEILGLADADDSDTLHTYAAKSPDNLRRAAIAAAFASFEEDLRNYHLSWGPNAQPYLELLEDHGHELSDIEQKKIAKKGAKR